MAQSATEFNQGPTPSFGAEGEAAVKARSPRQLFWMRFKEDKVAIFGLVLVVMMVFVASSPRSSAEITGHDFDQQFRDRLDEFGTPMGPDGEFWFGNDDLGRDLFVRVMYGARVSLKIAIIATGIELFLGVLLGMLAGFGRGWVDTIVSRFIDLILSIPFLLLGVSRSRCGRRRGDDDHLHHRLLRVALHRADRARPDALVARSAVR